MRIVTLLGCWLLLCVAALPAQRFDYEYKDSIPFPEDADTYLDRQHKRFWVRVDGKWQMAHIPYVNSAREWKGHYYLGTGDMKALVDKTGRVLFEPSHWILEYGDHFLGYVCGKGSYLLTLSGDTLAFSPGGEDKSLRSYQQVNGLQGVCLAQYFPALREYRKDRIRTWGLIGQQGDWIIAPVYDEPFRFEGQAARVIYKGEERWINGNGDFIPAPILPPDKPDQ